MNGFTVTKTREDVEPCCSHYKISRTVPADAREVRCDKCGKVWEYQFDPRECYHYWVPVQK